LEELLNLAIPAIEMLVHLLLELLRLPACLLGPLIHAPACILVRPLHALLELPALGICCGSTVRLPVILFP
jgi:hypothetical protein